MTRNPWTYRGVRVVPHGTGWDATASTNYPLRARTKNAIRAQIDDYLATRAEANERIFENELAAAHLECPFPATWGIWP